MPDMHEAGRKADAHRIRDLYRTTFGNSAKQVARRRAIQVLKAAGGQTALDLWGGGVSANEMVAAGLNVISIDDGSLDIRDHGSAVSAARKRRALELTADEDGYQARWGSVPAFAAECDVAFLDFCGPWSKNVRLAVEACRHMNAVVVTLVTDHDINSTATSQRERLEAYKAFLRLAYVGPSAQAMAAVGCRLLCHYKSSSGHPVWVFLMSKSRLPIKHFTPVERRQLMTDQQRALERQRHEARMQDPAKRAHDLARQDAWRRAQRATDPEGFRERQRTANRASYAKRKARLRAAAVPELHATARCP